MAESPWLPRGRCGGVLRPGTRQETFPTRRKNKGSGTMVSSSTAGLLKSGSCFVLQNKNPQSNQELLPLKRWSCFTQVLWGSWRQTLAPQKFLVGSVGEEEQPFIGPSFQASHLVLLSPSEAPTHSSHESLVPPPGKRPVRQKASIHGWRGGGGSSMPGRYAPSNPR